MRLILFLCTLSLFAADVPAGSHVLLRLQNSITSRTAKVGDFVYMQTATPIASGGTIVVPAGSHVQGVVEEVNRGGRVKGRAELAIRIEALILASGQQYKLAPRIASLEDAATGQTVIDRENTIQQGSTAGRDTARVVILTGQGAMVGALAGRWGRNGTSLRNAGIGAGSGLAVGVAATLLTRGRDVELRQGSSLDVVFDQPLALIN